MSLTRRKLLASATVLPFVGRAKAAESVFRGKQLHDQPAESHQHQFLADLWDAVRNETGGKVDVTVFPENNKVAGGAAVTNHSWAGFNLIANMAFWQTIPSELQAVIDRNVKKYVSAQRTHVQQLNAALEPKLKERGMIFTQADAESFRKKLVGEFYPRWKKQLGSTAWQLLEEKVGRLG